LCALAGGGQVFVSSAVATTVTSAGLQVEACGARELRGFPSPLPVFRVTGP
jgi:class 3 adenylate cyclase